MLTWESRALRFGVGRTPADVEECDDVRDGFRPYRRGGSQVLFHHRGPDGAVALTSDYESEGTLSALTFFSRALSVLGRGGVLLVDELDMSLHPTLVREFVSLFFQARH